MTAQPITPDQEKQYKRFVDDACDRGLKEVAPDKDDLQRLFARGGEFQAYVVAGIRRFTAKMPNYDLAKTILGKDFISPEEIAKSRRLTYIDAELATFGETLPDETALAWCRENGCALVAGPPNAMSLLDIRAHHNPYFYTKEDGWYADPRQKFSRDDKADPVWIALKKEPVEGSRSRTWSQQIALVKSPMIVPNAAEAVWGLTTYKAVRGVYLLPNVYVRTSSIDSFGHRVRVGYFDSNGLYVLSYSWDDYPLDHIGVAGARKFN